jgi:hypothetical protein
MLIPSVWYAGTAGPKGVPLGRVDPGPLETE